MGGSHDGHTPGTGTWSGPVCNQWISAGLDTETQKLEMNANIEQNACY